MKWLPIHSELYGLNVHRAVLAAGQATTGVSVHLVTEEYDAGPVIAQCHVSVEATDTPETLAQRVQESERLLMVEVLTGIALGGSARLPLAAITAVQRSAAADPPRRPLSGDIR